MGVRWHLYRDAEPRRGVLTAALLAGLFIVLALISRLLCKDQIGNTAIWPANAALVVTILTLPRRLSSITMAVCFGSNILLNKLSRYTPEETLLFSSLNVAMSYLAAFLTRSLCGAATDLTRFRRLWVFAAITLISAAAEATLGDLIFPGPPSDSSQIANWTHWTLGDGLGLLLATPAILLAVKSYQAGQICDAGVGERWLLLVGTFLLALTGFYYAHTALFLVIYPVLILTAFRAGPAWVLASVLLTAMTVSVMTAHGYGPIVLLSRSGLLMRDDLMQLYLVSLFLATVPANNALGEKNRAGLRLQRLKAALEHSATHDGLTTLVNRDLFWRRLSAMLQAGTARAVFFVDLDRFKQVNDTLGHQAGDELLRAFSARLTAAVRADATVARFGGDEFAVLLAHGGDEMEVETTCEAIVEAARTPFDLFSGPAHVSASIGVSLVGDDGAETGELMRRADIALYAVKAAGRDGYRVFSGELDDLVRERAELEADLRSAMDSESELSLHYQPKFAADGTARGVEALIRWTHPRLGRIAPPRFISIAEETGLILPLGAWVFREAVAFATRWPDLCVAVNISPVQLRHPEFVHETLDVLHAASLPAGRMELEVTETVLMDEGHPATGRLTALRAAGLSIALDDFGTGYSSLRHLHRFTVDRVKIDQSFVRSLCDSAESAAIVRAVISLGHAMGLQVTAEGVETEAQRDYLVRAGVDELQGNYLAGPVTEAALETVLSRPIRHIMLAEA